jgi:ferrous iron transport protein A
MHRFFSHHRSHARARFVNTLLDLKPGERATFVGVHGGRIFSGRLIALGFTPGAEVVMMQNHRRGPLLVSVRGTYVALGRGEAARVQIERKPS